jgi:glutamyl/glutaminyl-tRNA synthetase
MAFLGWNPGDEREIFSMRSLIKEFSLERCQKGGAVFNIKRLDFLNGFYIRNLSLNRLTEKCLPYFIEAKFITPIEILNLNNNNSKKLKLKPQIKTREFKITRTGEIVEIDWISKIVAIEQERLKKLSEITELTDFFFKDKLDYSEELLKWKDMPDKEIKENLEKAEKILSGIREGEWTKENLENVLMPEAEKLGDRGKLLWPLRAALTGKQASAGPFEIAEILGKKRTLDRIKNAKVIVEN